jgi:alpha-tubulin suppressor-like RCC1 family protein
MISDHVPRSSRFAPLFAVFILFDFLLPSAKGATGPVIWGSQTFDIRDFDKPITAIAAGFMHTIAIKNDGKVTDWGTTYSLNHVPPGLSGVKAAAAGGTHTAVLKTDGTVVVWGGQHLRYYHGA